MSERIPFPKSEETLRKKPCAGEPGFGIARADRRSGRWTCTLRTINPLCIKSHFEARAAANAVEIPGSSLRGMVRNAAEIIGAGCGRFHENASTPIEPCTHAAACLVCRVFGFINEPPNEFCWTSRVRFQDSDRRPVVWERYRIVGADRPPGSDKPGWIVFPSEKVTLPEGRDGILCVPAGETFTFRVDFSNLDEEEASLLQFALTLKFDDEHLDHMLGHAKALGFGRCRISVTEPLGGLDSAQLAFVDQDAIDELCYWRFLR